MSHAGTGIDAAARLARFARTQDARDLWPGVEPAAFRQAQRSLAAALATVLGGEVAALASPEGTDTRTMGVAASAAGIGPLLGAWCSEGKIRAAPELAALYADHLAHGRRRAERLTGVLNRVLLGCAERGIPVVLLKGADTGRRYFAEPALRVGADVDVLVPAADLPRVNALLARLGYDGPHAARSQRATWHVPGPDHPGPLDLAHEDDPVSVDLHVSLERGPFPGIRSAPLVPDVAACGYVAGLEAPALGLPQPLALLFLALHASYHLATMQLIRLVEIVTVARADFAGPLGPARWDELREMMRAKRLARFVYPAFALAEQLAPGSLDARALAEAQADAAPWLRARVRRLTPGDAQRVFTAPGTGGLQWARTPSEVALGIADLAWPPAALSGRVSPVMLGRIYAARAARVVRAAGRLLG